MVRPHGRGADRTGRYSFVVADYASCWTFLAAAPDAVFSSVAVCTSDRKHRQHGEHYPALLGVNVT